MKGARHRIAVLIMNDDPQTEAAKEQQRLIISIAIIATALGLYSIGPPAHAMVEMLKAFISIPSLLLGFYILFSAVHLKYKSAAEMGSLDIPEKLRRGSYDTGINMFWIMILIVTALVSASFGGWNGDMLTFLQFWPSMIISFIVLAILVVISAVAIDRERTGVKKNKLRKRQARSKK